MLVAAAARPGGGRILVEQLGIHQAMIMPAILCAGIIALAATMPRQDTDLTG